MISRGGAGFGPIPSFSFSAGERMEVKDANMLPLLGFFDGNINCVDDADQEHKPLKLE